MKQVIEKELGSVVNIIALVQVINQVIYKLFLDQRQHNDLLRKITACDGNHHLLSQH